MTYPLPPAPGSVRHLDSLSGYSSLNGLVSVVSSRFSLSRMNSNEGIASDPFVTSGILPRESLNIANNMIWDPTMCQLQRAPDSIQVLNNSVYDGQSNLQPMLLPIQSLPQATVIRKPSLLAQVKSAESGQGDKDVASLNTEVCFNEDSSNDGIVCLPSGGATEAASTAEVAATGSTESETLVQAVIVKCDSTRSTGSESPWVNLEAIRQVSPIGSVMGSVHAITPDASTLVY